MPKALAAVTRGPRPLEDLAFIRSNRVEELRLAWEGLDA